MPAERGAEPLTTSSLPFLSARLHMHITPQMDRMNGRILTQELKRLTGHLTFLRLFTFFI